MAAERIGARACITKPFELDHLVEAVDTIIGDSRLGPTEADRRIGTQFVAEA
jgi:DNA-binding NarL/FixJ family response regulator